MTEVITKDDPNQPHRSSLFVCFHIPEDNHLHKSLINEECEEIMSTEGQRQTVLSSIINNIKEVYRHHRKL